MTLKRTRNSTQYIAIKELINEHSDYSITDLCVIAEISRAAFYKWVNRQDNDNDTLNNIIADKITSIHAEHPDMGYRRLRDTFGTG